MDILIIIVASASAAFVSAVLACVPGLHVYNVMGLGVACVHLLQTNGVAVPPEILLPVAVGMMVGYAVLNTLPSVLLAAPDESAAFLVSPGQKFFMTGRGYDAVIMTTIGGIAGLAILLGVAGPLAPLLLPAARAVFQPHLHWILWCVITFMLMSEWPKGGTRGQAGWRRFVDGWKSTGAGLVTFALSGLLGFVLFYGNPVALQGSFQSLMPGFVGLFTIPWLVLNLVNKAKPPRQSFQTSRLGPGMMLRGVVAGGLGGGFAAFFPGVTGGVGGMLAGHATATRDDRVFVVSQGASKVFYYVGGLLLFFVPGLHVTRGGGAWMLRGLYRCRGTGDYLMVLASIAISGAVALLMVAPLTRITIKVIHRFGFRMVSGVSLIAVTVLVALITGWSGLFVMFVAGGIGLLPVLFGSRRMNCLGVILLPIACNLSGVGELVASFLGLL
jgi:putative membrane protein